MCVYVFHMDCFFLDHTPYVPPRSLNFENILTLWHHSIVISPWILLISIAIDRTMRIHHFPHNFVVKQYVHTDKIIFIIKDIEIISVPDYQYTYVHFSTLIITSFFDIFLIFLIFFFFIRKKIIFLISIFLRFKRFNSLYLKRLKTMYFWKI